MLVPVACSTWRTSSRRRCSSRPCATTVAPCSAARCVSARPSPPVAPVIRMVCLSRGRIPAATQHPTRVFRALLADPAVDPLADQVGVPVVPGVLLHHVHEQLPQRDRLPAPVAAGDAEVARRVDVPLGEGALLPPRLPGVGD